MGYYIILIFIISMLWMYEASPICINIGKIGHTDKRKQVMVLIAVILVTITIFRDFTVGGDLVNYKQTFDYLRDMSFFRFLKMIDDRLFYGIFWLIGRFTDKFRYVMIVIGALTCYFLLSTIYRYSPCVSMSAFLLVSLGYLAYLFCVMRSGLAIAIVFWVYQYLEKKEYKKYFHMTAIIGLLMLFWSCVHSEKREILMYIVLFITCFVFAQYGIMAIIEMYKYHADYSKLLVRGQGKNLFMFRLGILFLVCLKYRSIISENPEIRLFYKSFIVGLALQILAMGLSILTRLTDYYVISLIIICPYAFQKVRIARNKMVFMGITLAIGFLFYIYVLIGNSGGLLPYSFMWS